MGVEAQVGGADQWGNITAGLELIRRTATGPTGEAAEAFGLSYPLLLDQSGAKFGKTSVGTSVWLDPARTSPYAFYQFLVDRPDTEVGKLLRLFTIMDRPEIEALEAEQAAHPERRPAQRALAVDLTTRVHGVAETERAMTVSHAAFSDEPVRDPAVLAAMYEVLEHCDLTREDLAGGALRLAIASGLFSSNGEARRAIAQGGFSINDVRVAAPDDPVPAPIGGQWLPPAGRPEAPQDRAGRWRERSARDDVGRRDGPARRAARGRGTGGRRSRRPGRCRVAVRSVTAASAVASSLAARRTSVASSVTLRDDGVDAAVEEPGGVRARRPGRGAVGDRRPERLEPGEALGRGRPPGAPSRSKQLRVPRWQVGPAGSTVARSASPSQSSARPRTASVLPLVSPLRHSRSREREWKCTSPVATRRGQRLGVRVREHEHPAVRGVLDDDRDEAVRAVGGLEPSGRPRSSCRGLVDDGPDRAGRRRPSRP